MPASRSLVDFASVLAALSAPARSQNDNLDVDKGSAGRGGGAIGVTMGVARGQCRLSGSTGVNTRVTCGINKDCVVANCSL